MELVRCYCKYVTSFPERRGLFLSKLRGKAIEAERIAINLRATADASNSFVVFALEMANVTQSIRGEWVNFLTLGRFCGVESMNVTSVGDHRGTFHLDDINAVFRSGICRLESTRFRREESHGRSGED